MVMGQLFIVCSSQLTENTQQTNALTLVCNALLLNLSTYYPYIDLVLLVTLKSILILLEIAYLIQERHFLSKC